MNDFLKLRTFYIGLLIKNWVMLQCAYIFYASSKKDQFRVFIIDQSGNERKNNNLVLSTEDNVYWPLNRVSKADFSTVTSPSFALMKGLKCQF